ncbi:MAG: hypothetical protein LBG59_02405 [Candidatus Peribacteria bacterium]|nr:hypothetical protein [Candidatus Peribacteria bacterium]
MTTPNLIQPLQNNPVLPQEKEVVDTTTPKKTSTKTATKADPNTGTSNIFDENGNPISGDKYWGTEKPMSGAEYWGREDKKTETKENTEKSTNPVSMTAQTFLPSETQLFGKLITGQDTTSVDPHSVEYQRAENRAREVNKIAALGAQGIVDGLAGGSILKGSRALQDIAQYYPELQKEIQAIQKQQQDLDMANSLSTGKTQGSMVINTTQDQQAVNDSLNQTVANMGGTQEAYDILQESISKDTDLQYFSDKSAYYASEIDKLDQTIDNLGQDIRKRMGADTPEYMIQAYINNRSGKLYQNRNQLLRQYNQYTAMYQSRVEEIEREKEWEYKERQLAMQQQQYDRSWAMDQSSNALNWSKFNAEYGGEVGTMRTERNNNPTAIMYVP